MCVARTRPEWARVQLRHCILTFYAWLQEFQWNFIFLNADLLVNIYKFYIVSFHLDLYILTSIYSACHNKV